MGIRVRGVRSVESEMSDPDSAVAFYTRVWNLTEVDARGGAPYLRGTGAYHHVLAIHPATRRPSLRRIIFDAADRETVEGLHRKVMAAAPRCETPHAVERPGGGYGFGFTDPEGVTWRSSAMSPTTATAPISPIGLARSLMSTSMPPTSPL